MQPPAFAILIGIIYGLFYLVVSGCAIAKLVLLGLEDERPNNYVGVGMIITGTIALLIYALTMAILSVLMIVGVRKERHQLIAPWVFASVVGIMGTALYLCISGYQLSTWDILSEISFIATQTLTWYPVFSLWNDLRKEATRAQTSDPTTPEWQGNDDTSVFRDTSDEVHFSAGGKGGQLG